jgi:hypothetical protein
MGAAGLVVAQEGLYVSTFEDGSAGRDCWGMGKRAVFTSPDQFVCLLTWVSGA